MIRRRVVVHGRVQCVFFRDSLRRLMLGHGVSGWARNTVQGTVEAVFEGEPDAVERLVAYARTGRRRPRLRQSRSQRRRPRASAASRSTSDSDRRRTRGNGTHM